MLLLPSLLALILLYPVVTRGPFAGYLVLALNAVVLISAVYAVAESRAQVRIAVALAAPQFAVSVAAGLFPADSATHRWLSVTAAALLAVFYAYAIRRLLLGVLAGMLTGVLWINTHPDTSLSYAVVLIPLHVFVLLLSIPLLTQSVRPVPQFLIR